MSISGTTIKKLWGKSAGKCNFPGCNQPCIMSDENIADTVIGEMAHVIAHSPQGPRGDGEGNNDSYQNLILLCPTHHQIIDSNPEQYSIERLHQMKKEWEAHVLRQTQNAPRIDINISQVYYMNLPRLAMLSVMNGQDDFDIQLSLPLISNGLDLIRGMILVLAVIPNLRLKTRKYETGVEEFHVGEYITFNNSFRTKNVPSSTTVQLPNYQISMNTPPHIYLKTGNQKLILHLDPKWLTTTTSFVNFSSGHVSVAGVALIKEIDNYNIFASPLVLGTPHSFMDDFWN